MIKNNTHLFILRNKCLFPLFLLLLGFIGARAAETLYVIFPTEIRPQAMQKKLEEACPGVTITVFGRYKDFETKCTTEPPDAIIASPALVKQMEGYTVKLDGTMSDKAEEPYVVLSLDAPIDLAALSETTISVIDAMGKKGLDDMVAAFFKSPPKLKKLTKVEDLLPTLTFNLSKGILIPEFYVKYLKSTSNLNFVNNALPGAQTGIVVLATKKDANVSATEKAVKAFKKDLLIMFRINGWRGKGNN